MRIRHFFVTLACVLVCGVSWYSSAGAVALKVAPVEYRATLAKKEVKRGFIDVSNPSTQTVRVKVQVQGFRQVDNKGSLQFFTDTQLGHGIIPDLRSFELGSKEAMRVFFDVKAKKLPSGDVFAAVFFITEPKDITRGVGQSVRVGTLLSIINGNPGQREAEVKSLNVGLLQFNENIRGTYAVKNIGDASSGFYPSVKVSSWPNEKEKSFDSSLVFGGRERENDFVFQPGFGVHRIDVSFGKSVKSAWVIVLPPWLVGVIGIVVLVVLTELLLLHRRRNVATP